MTRAESSGTEEGWTSGKAAARRKALTDAGMESPVAETLVDLLDEQTAPMMTRAEADARFVAMLDRHDAQRSQDRAEINVRFAELRGDMDARFAELKGEMHSRFGSVEGQIAGLAGQVGMLKWTFGSFMAFITLLLGLLAYTMASAAS